MESFQSNVLFYQVGQKSYTTLNYVNIGLTPDKRLLLIIRSLNLLLYSKTFSLFFWNSSVSPRADCESNRVHRYFIQPLWQNNNLFA